MAPRSLGSELIKGYVHPGQMAKDFTTLAGLVDTLWAGRPKKPIVAGADEVCGPGFSPGTLSPVPAG